MNPRLKPLEITPTIFDELAGNVADFHGKVRQHYFFTFQKGGFEPIINPRRLDDAQEEFCLGKERAKDSMHPKSRGRPDHFKLSGVLVYWLCRTAPVSDLRPLYSGSAPDPVYEELLENYPSEFAAYMLGLHICGGIETGKPDSALELPDLAANNFDYYRDICYLLKRKNLSPHSLGMIYRSLFVPLRPINP